MNQPLPSRGQLDPHAGMPRRTTHGIREAEFISHALAWGMLVAVVAFAAPLVAVALVVFAPLVLLDVGLFYVAKGRRDRARTGALAWALYLSGLGNPWLVPFGVAVRLAGVLGDRWHLVMLAAALLHAIAWVVRTGARLDVLSMVSLTVFQAAIFLGWWAMFWRSRLSRRDAAAAHARPMDGSRPQASPRSSSNLSAAERAELEAVRKMFRS